MNLTLWVRQVCGFLILSSILKNLLAQRRYSPYVKLFMNLLLVLLLAQPLMRVDLERLNGIWSEVSVNPNKENWREELAILAGYDGNLGQAEDVLYAQIETLVAQKGYLLEDVSLSYDEKTNQIQKIDVIVSEMEDYIREPVIWNKDTPYIEREADTSLRQYLEEILKPAADVTLNVRIR